MDDLSLSDRYARIAVEYEIVVAQAEGATRYIMEKCHGPIALQKDGLRAIDCQVCGFMHLDPLPTQAQLTSLYEDEYYQSFNKGWFKKEKREWWYWRREYQGRCKRFELLHLSKKKGHIRAFDWGAGAGWFVRAADKMGPRWLVTGYEPNEYARQWAATHTALVVDSPANCWHEDFIHCSLVLEHVLDPLTLLKELTFRLSPGGLLCLVVPSEYSPLTDAGNDLQRRLSDRFGYSPLHPHHLNYFTLDSLVSLIECTELEIIQANLTFPMELFPLRTLLNYLKFARLGTVAHWTRMAIETLSLFREKRLGWAKQGWGREVELWCQKKA